ncbi:MAG: accessory gene regulator B family protein [Clostridiales bacterium]|nr:accessory gene regulator B family protein [Clostridiales bacterium]
MEKAAHKLSERIAFHLQYHEEKRSVVEYGLLAIFNIIIIGVTISCIGSIFSIFYECAVIFIGVGILKKSTGGAHAETLTGCVIVSVLSITLFAAVSRYALGFPMSIFLNIGMTLAVLLAGVIVFYRSVPVDSPNKPIRKPEKIRRLRRQSFVLLGLFSAFSVLAAVLAPVYERFYSIAFCIRFILLWQTFMLTTYGNRFIRFLTKKYDDKEVM